MATAETNILNACMVALSKAGVLCFRNNSGALRDANGRLVRYGLGVGSSDLVCVCPDGLAAFIEVKTPTGRASPAQTAFIAAVRRQGARAGIARCPADALAIAAQTPD